MLSDTGIRPGKEKDMDNFEKIEKLVEKTGVSYKDAKRVLEEANGDLLDAMIILEQEGKASAPKNSTYSTEYDEQTQYVSVPQQVENVRRENSEKTSTKFKRLLHKIAHILKTNYMVVRRKDGDVVVNLPLWGVALILLFSWWITCIVIVGSLFFGYTYTFTGEADLGKANEVMDKVTSAAEKAKEEFEKL